MAKVIIWKLKLLLNIKSYIKWNFKTKLFFTCFSNSLVFFLSQTDFQKSDLHSKGKLCKSVWTGGAQSWLVRKTNYDMEVKRQNQEKRFYFYPDEVVNTSFGYHLPGGRPSG